MKLAIIGAGISGLTCAQEAISAGHNVTLFDKGRGPGGRCSTRRVESALGQMRFDHGAIGFQCTSEEFRRETENWIARGWVESWRPRTLDKTDDTEWYTGVPGMNNLVKGLAAGLNVRFGERIALISQTSSGWLLSFEGDTPDFECEGIICAVPAEQAAILLEQPAPEYSEQAKNARSQPCWSAMFGFSEPVNAAFDLAVSDTEAFSRIVRNTSKPGRDQLETWVVQATAAWSEAHLNMQKENVTDKLLTVLHNTLGISTSPVVSTAHRWLYSQIKVPSKVPANWDNVRNIGTCGDWHIGPNIEHAWLSGRVLGERLKSL